MTPLQHLQLVASATEAALLSGPDRDKVRNSLRELAKLLQPDDSTIKQREET